MFNQTEFINFIIEKQIVKVSAAPFTLASGMQSHFYVNWRSVTENVKDTDTLCNFIIDFVKDKKLPVDLFYGIPEGGTKVGLISQYKWAMQNPATASNYMLSIGRGKIKDHGDRKDKFFLGIPKGNVVLIEDVVTTGDSLISAINTLDSCDINITGVIALTDRLNLRHDEQLLSEHFKSIDIPYFSLSNSLEILKLFLQDHPERATIKPMIEKEYERQLAKGVISKW